MTTMQIHPIRTDKDHRNALVEIEKLWGASIETPEGDKLDILATLVETYEGRRWSLRSRRRFDPALPLCHYCSDRRG
jgi:antitoxin component HigA of HigAB toxin-antitoxin module